RGQRALEKQKMKFAIIFAVLIIISVSFYAILSYEKSLFRINDFLEQASSTKTGELSSHTTTTADPSSGSTAASTTRVAPVPPGFRGPSGNPTIIGPSGPPPNY
ncbi:MAG: hypothetical protein AAB655_01755, partial [Patescibacteria group bacterium]